MPQLRSAAALALIGLLLLCPLLCGPGDGRCAVPCEQQECPVPCNVPDPCDEGGDNCICQGATLASWLNAPAKATLANPSVSLSLPGVLLRAASPAQAFGPSSLRVPDASPDGAGVRLLIQSLLS